MNRTLPSAVCAAVLLAGCASPEVRTTPPSYTGDPVVDGKAMADHVPARDRVLWQYKTAATAMRRGQYGEAKALLDDALVTLGGTQGPDATARRARSLFKEESKKTFIGEPYERVMAYYYRGILYWMDGEPDNARACFRSAQIYDADAEKQAYAADYALLDYLDGFATAKLGDDGSAAFDRAKKESKLEEPPAYNKKANVLCFVEYGEGPRKYAAGQYREQLRFRPGLPRVFSAAVTINGQTVRARPYDDLYFQATTRGGRVMDHVLANKAVFKQSTDAAGDVGIVSGAILASQGGRHSAADEVGLGLLAAGIVSKIASAATRPQADVRMWDNLPQYLSFAAFELPPGQHTVTMDFFNNTGGKLVNLTRTLQVTVPAAGGKDVVVFASDHDL